MEITSKRKFVLGERSGSLVVASVDGQATALVVGIGLGGTGQLVVLAMGLHN